MKIKESHTADQNLMKSHDKNYIFFFYADILIEKSMENIEQNFKL